MPEIRDDPEGVVARATGEDAVDDLKHAARVGDGAAVTDSVCGGRVVIAWGIGGVPATDGRIALKGEIEGSGTGQVCQTTSERVTAVAWSVVVPVAEAAGSSRYLVRGDGAVHHQTIASQSNGPSEGKSTTAAESIIARPSTVSSLGPVPQQRTVGDDTVAAGKNRASLGKTTIFSQASIPAIARRVEYTAATCSPHASVHDKEGI